MSVFDTMREPQTAIVHSLRPGDVIAFRHTNRPHGEWPWTNEPWIFVGRSIMSDAIIVRRPFEIDQTLYLDHVEIKILARRPRDEDEL